MKFLKAKWNSWRRRAKWLIVCSLLYAIPTAILITLDILDWDELGHMGPRWQAYGFQMQIVWLFITSTPLWIKPIGNWVFMRKVKS